MTVGLVVAGGYSARFGVAEKALVEVDEEPMLWRAVSTLAPLVDAVVVDCRSDQVEPFRRALAPLPCEPRFAVDAEPDAGPVAGLETGLEAARRTGSHSEVLVSSCDRPGVTTAALRALRERRWGADVAAAVPTVDGHVQPLCGSYRFRALLDACRAVRSGGGRRLCSVTCRLCHLAVPASDLADDPAAFRSVDTALEAAAHPGHCRRAAPIEGLRPPAGQHEAGPTRRPEHS